MKKIILVLVLALCSNYILLNAQEASDPIVQIEKNDEAKVRFGLHGMGSIDWLTPENQKKFLSGGVGIGYGWGPQLEFR